MESGVTVGQETADWSSLQEAIAMELPKAQMKGAFGQGATHMIYWKVRSRCSEADDAPLVLHCLCIYPLALTQLL